MSKLPVDRDKSLNMFLDCLSEKIDIFEFYLFGSYIKGNFNAWSDLDVIIVSDYFESVELPDRKYLVASIKNNLAVRLLDVKVISLSEWENGFGFLGHIRNKVVKWEFNNGNII
uniref:Polymerase nucleotidyl transferase domain-containing protein n=2 Tax=Pseudoalteromonas rubra TaxID=43658 RepID=A0A0F4QL00_9GAMM|nr:hypothetical protein TW77_13765 [Pseudoalteromonas rubra]